MPASSTNIWKSESMLMPARNKSDMAEQMKALKRKMMVANMSSDHKEAQPKAEKPPTKKNCLCSPTTHPGSFRCRLHRAVQGRHHPSAVAKENNSHHIPNFNFKCASNLSPSKLSRFSSTR